MYACLSDDNFRKPSPIGSSYLHIRYHGIRVWFVYEGHRVKVKVTAAKKIANASLCIGQLLSVILSVLARWRRGWSGLRWEGMLVHLVLSPASLTLTSRSAYNIAVPLNGLLCAKVPLRNYSLGDTPVISTTSLVLLQLTTTDYSHHDYSSPLRLPITIRIQFIDSRQVYIFFFDATITRRIKMYIKCSPYWLRVTLYTVVWLMSVTPSRNRHQSLTCCRRFNRKYGTGVFFSRRKSAGKCAFPLGRAQFIDAHTRTIGSLQAATVSGGGRRDSCCRWPVARHVDVWHALH